MSEQAPVVAVEVEESPDVEPTPTTVVVADTGGNESDDLAIGVALGQLTAEVATLSGAVSSLAERVDVIDARTQIAEELASEAIGEAIDAQVAVEEVAEVAEEVAEETAEETTEELIEPVREHRIWRNPVRLRRGHDVT